MGRKRQSGYAAFKLMIATPPALRRCGRLRRRAHRFRRLLDGG